MSSCRTPERSIGHGLQRSRAENLAMFDDQKFS